MGALSIYHGFAAFAVKRGCSIAPEEATPCVSLVRGLAGVAPAVDIVIGAAGEDQDGGESEGIPALAARSAESGDGLGSVQLHSLSAISANANTSRARA